MDISNPRIPSESIQPSSYAPGVQTDDLRIGSPSAWYPDPSDEEPYVDIDLMEPTEVTGVTIQGGGPETDDFVTKFAVLYSTDGGETFVPILYNGEPMVGFFFYTMYTMER